MNLLNPMNQWLSAAVIVSLSFSGFLACSSSDSESGGGGAGLTVASAFPSDLAISSPTSSELTVSSVTLKEAKTKVRYDEVSSSAGFADKRALLEKMLTATTIEDCKFTFSLSTNSQNAACYGPALQYQNHPDGSGPSASGNFPSGDLGLWEENNTSDGVTEACAAAQKNAKVGNINTLVDTAVYSAAAMACVVAVNGLDLPEAEGSLDLTEALSEAFTTLEIDFTVSSASIAREADTSDGHEVFVYTIEGSADSKDVVLRLKHVATAEDDSSYRGKLSYTVSDASTSLGNCIPTGVTGQKDAVSVAYEKVSNTELNIDLRSGTFCGSDADPFVSSTNFTVDSTKRSSTLSSKKGWANNFNMALFSMNPENQTGSYQFAWQAGDLDSNSRTLNLTLDTNEDGIVAGCAYFGFGDAIQNGRSAAAIDRFICAWTGPGSDHTGVTKAQKQCMTQNDETKAFESDSDTLAITYAPSASCTGGSGFEYKLQGSSDPFEPFPTSSNLVNIADITDLTDPVAPTEVDE